MGEVLTLESLINQMGLSLLKGEDVNKVQILKQHRRAISYNETKGYYYTTTNDGVRKQGKTKEKLFDVLVEHYSNTSTFKKVFDEAVEAHKKLVSERTYEDYFDTYNYYVDESFSKMNIKDMTPYFVSEYIAKKCDEKHPREKHLKRFIGVLNIVFSYAINQRIVLYNPTPTSLTPFRSLLTYDVKRAEDKAYSVAEANAITDEVIKLIKSTKDYDKTIKAFTLLFALNSGVRIGEIPPLKWEDIGRKHIHIHSQQVSRNVNGHIEYYIINSTKDEKRHSQGGRWIKNTQNLKVIFSSIKNMQKRFKIDSEYVFALRDGSCCTVRQIDNAHRTICKKLGLKLTNIHAIRMYFNSYVLAKNKECTNSDNAAYLGHSLRVNLDCYSFEERDYVDKLGDTIDEIVPPIANLTPTILLDIEKAS